MKLFHHAGCRAAYGFWVVVASLSLLCGSGLSQEKSQVSPGVPHQEPPAVLKVTTRLVTVDVVARDHHGNPVHDLQQGEFLISEQAGSRKSEQEIASFRLLDRAAAKEPDAEREVLQLPAGVYTNLVTTKSLSVPPTILLVDGLNTEEATQLEVRQDMVRLLASTPADEPVAVFLLGRELRLLQNFTADTKLLHAAAQRALTLEAVNLQEKDARDDSMSHSSLLERSGNAEGQSDSPGEALGREGNSNSLLARRALQLQRFERERYAESVDVRAKLTLDALRMIARHASGYPGRKNLIWISSAFPVAIRPDAQLAMNARFSGVRNYASELSAVASALADAQIAVYPVDPRGMQTQALFDAESRAKKNPFSGGATLGRETDVRFANQESMQNLAEQTGGQVCLNNNDLSQCVRRAIDDSSSYYELAYYPSDKNWHGEFRRISVRTTRPGVRLSYREGYFARDSDPAAPAREPKEADARIAQAACNDFLTATSILVEASAVPPDQPGQAKYFIVIDPNALSIAAPEGGARNLQMEVATCMFNERGLPLQYNRQSVAQKFTEAEYQSLKTHGVSHTISFVPKPETARVRLLVCDTQSGMIGSVDLPYPTAVISASAGKNAGDSSEPARVDVPSGPKPEGVPHVIKFHDEDGREARLEWGTTKVVYSGDVTAQLSAEALFGILYGKGYSCETGKLLSINDKTTPAPQPLHFDTDSNHGAEVYLDGPEGVKYAGNVAVDDSAKPVFEALRIRFQCRQGITGVPK